MSNILGAVLYTCVHLLDIIRQGGDSGGGGPDTLAGEHKRHAGLAYIKGMKQGRHNMLQKKVNF